jgi:hypothetical protein
MVPRPQGVADSHIQVIRVEVGAGSPSGRIGTGKRWHGQHREIVPLVSSGASAGRVCSARRKDVTTNTTVPHVTTKPTASEPATVRALEVANGIPLLSVKGAPAFAGTFPPTQDLLYRGVAGLSQSANST